MNTDKNSYTIIYATVMVIVAAVLLASVAIGLKPAQQENAKIDKMEQILRSFGQIPDKSAVVDTYKRMIKAELLLDGDGKLLETYQGDDLAESKAFNNNTEFEMKRLLKREVPTSDIRLNAFVAEFAPNPADPSTIKTVIILPLNGSGLWDKIWGYIAVDALNGSTVIGADFGNKGETPGLGAEISTPRFAEQFVGKELMKDGVFRGIAVVKPGKTADGQDTVDGISGGTLTSDGVHAMLENSLKPYKTLLKNYQNK